MATNGAEIDGLVAKLGGGHMGAGKPSESESDLVLPTILLTPANEGAGGDDKMFFPESTGDDGEPLGQRGRSSPTGMNVFGGESKIEDAAAKETRKKSEAHRSTKKRSGSSHQVALRKTMAETPTQESYRDLTAALEKFK